MRDAEGNFTGPWTLHFDDLALDVEVARLTGGETALQSLVNALPESALLRAKLQAEVDAITKERRRLEAIAAVRWAERKQQPNLYEAATALREAQRAYMEDRGNDELGRKVGLAAAVLDDVLAKLVR